MKVIFRDATERDRDIFDWRPIGDARARPLVVEVEGVVVLVKGDPDPQYVVGRMPGDLLRIANRVTEFWTDFMNKHSDYSGRLAADVDPVRRLPSFGDVLDEALDESLTPSQAEVLRWLEARPQDARTRRRRGATLRGILQNVPTAMKNTVDSLVQGKLVERRAAHYYLVRPKWHLEGEVVAEEDRPAEQAEIGSGEEER